MYDVFCCQGHVNQCFALTLDSLNPETNSFSPDFYVNLQISLSDIIDYGTYPVEYNAVIVKSRIISI